MNAKKLQKYVILNASILTEDTRVFVEMDLDLVEIKNLVLILTNARLETIHARNFVLIFLVATSAIARLVILKNMVLVLTLTNVRSPLTHVDHTASALTLLGHSNVNVKQAIN